MNEHGVEQNAGQVSPLKKQNNSFADEHAPVPPPVPKGLGNARQKSAITSFLHPPNRFPAYEVLLLIVLTGLFDCLFYLGSGGLSYAIAMALIPLTLIGAASARRFSLSLAMYGTVCVLLSLRYAWHVSAWNVVVGVFALVGFAVVLKSGRGDVAFLGASFIPTCLAGAVRWVEYLMVSKAGKKSVMARDLEPRLVKAVCVPLAVTGAFALVFFLSNPIIRDLFREAYAYIQPRLEWVWDTFGPRPLRVLFWLLSLWFLASLFRPYIVARGVKDKPAAEDGFSGAGPSGSGAFTHRTSLNTLIAVNILFLFYNVFDAYYLVLQKTLPPGLNHSQFAHQGAIWLTVALAMSTFVLGGIFRGPLRSHANAKRLFASAWIWIAQNFLIAVWVLLRLRMYISYNGLTRMRIVGLYGTALVMAGLVLVSWAIWRRKPLCWLVRKELAAFAVAVALLAVTPLDLFAWGLNVKLIRAMDVPKPAVQLVVQPIAPEGLMMLPPLLSHEDPVIAKGAAALLGQWYFAHSQTETAPDNGRRWTQYQASRHLCLSVLSAYEDDILSLIPDKNWQDHLDALDVKTKRWI